MQAGDLAAAVERQLREAGQELLDARQRQHVAVDPLGVVGVELEVDRRQLRGRAGDGDRGARRVAGLVGGVGAEDRADVLGEGGGRAARGAWGGGGPGKAGGAPGGGGGGRGGGGGGGWGGRGGGAPPPACVETWKCMSRPRPSTNSVEPPPMSMTTTAVWSVGSRSETAPRNVSRASSSPGSSWASRR